MAPAAVTDMESNFDEIFEGDSNPIVGSLLIFAKIFLPMNRLHKQGY